MKKKEIIAFYPLLELFSRLNEKDQSILLKHITCDGCDAFLECIHNAMWNDKIDRKERKLIQRKFNNYKILFRFFNSHKIDPEEKYKELRQEGSGIGSIVGILLPYVKEFCDYHSEDSLKYGDINNDENFPRNFMYIMLLMLILQLLKEKKTKDHSRSNVLTVLKKLRIRRIVF